ncbi:MAG: hypothetical protein AB8I08_21795 [Sandaracinaceae bacterium]
MAVLLTLAGCDAGPRSGLPVVPEIPRPACVEGAPESESRHLLVAGPTMRERSVVETFSLHNFDGCQAVRVEQEWARGTADVEVVFDAEGLPLRIWRRTTIPDASGPLGHLDLRVYDLTASPVVMARRGPSGEREGESLRGERPRVVIGPGRGLLTAWIQRASLAVGERLRETAIDVREPIAVIRDVTLRREADRAVAELGTVRVYTIYGREPVFADADNVVIGDLFGMRRADALPGPVPDPMPDRESFDPTQLP